MRAIEFTHDEKKLLKIVLSERMDYFKAHINQLSIQRSKKQFQKDYIDPITSVLDKYSDEIYNDYSKREKLMIRSCINEHLGDYQDNLDLKDALAWTNISAEQEALANQIDCASDILKKCRLESRREPLLRYNPDFRYRDVFEIIGKMKKSNLFFLSGTNHLYKLAFVYQDREFLTFELKNPILLYHIRFSALTEPASKYGSRYFSKVTTRENAFDILQRCKKEYYPSGVIDFVCEMLN